MSRHSGSPRSTVIAGIWCAASSPPSAVARSTREGLEVGATPVQRGRQVHLRVLVPGCCRTPEVRLRAGEVVPVVVHETELVQGAGRAGLDRAAQQRLGLAR